jgi:uncharacterized protein (TIGR00297 family)
LILSTAIGLLAYCRGLLSRSGVAGAVLIGTCVFGFGGWVWGGTLIAFFVSSSLLSHYGESRKSLLQEKFAKDSRRDLAQTLANGGLAAALAVVAGLVGRTAPAFLLLALAFYGALAAANADTWATELGVLAKQQPRLITTGKLVPVGTSGGVTWQGTAAALAGAAFIGLSAFLLIQAAARFTLGSWLLRDWVLIPIAGVSGLVGSTFDSLLGATAQATYYCDNCNKETEQVIHRCGQAARLLRGWRWLDNDWVNFLASLVGAGIAALLGMLLF